MTTPSQNEAGDDRPTTGSPSADQGDAPTLPAGDDVRVGPEQSDEPEAGAAEPTD